MIGCFVFGLVMEYNKASSCHCIQLFRERLSEKKTSKCTRQDRKVVWVFTGILHIGLKEIYKFVFLHVENLFSSQGHISVALRLLSHVFE